MNIEETKLQGCFVINPTVFSDDRGYFFESFNREKFKSLTNVDTLFVQDNESMSAYGTIRGLHAQKEPYAQAKLVRVTKGIVLDVAVDFRPNSPTYQQYITQILSEENKKQLFVPRGFLHGFAVLSEIAIFNYKCDNYYNKSAEFAVRHDDPQLNINWQIPLDDQILSERDRNASFIQDI